MSTIQAVTLSDLLTACRTGARTEGWDGNDAEYEYTREDMIWVVSQWGRSPTREEWRAAGLEWVGDAHVSEAVEFTAPEWADTIITEEAMDAATVGPVACLVLTEDGRLADDNASEPADLSSPDAFRAQVQRWRQSVTVSPQRLAVAAEIERSIAAAREEIADLTDGPLSAFVLIGRACLGASKDPEHVSAYANALYEELVERGWLDAGAVEITGS